MVSSTIYLLAVAVLLLISVLLSRTASRTGLPMLVIFLAIGMLAGEEGLAGISFKDYSIAQFMGNVALCFILFSGGMDTKYEQIKPVLWRGVTLSTAGVLITALSLGVFVYMVTDLGWLESFLLGSIVSSTDAAAVFAIFRSKNTGLKRGLRPTLELESGSNDPMAYFLTITFIGLVQNPEGSIWSTVPQFFLGMALGGAMGWCIGKLTVKMINAVNLFIDGLYSVLVIAMMLLSYALTDFIGGNGFLAIYIAGLILGNSNFIHKRALLKFYDGFAWLMQILMFLTLGLLVTPSHILPVAGVGMLIAVFLIFVARPLAVWLCLLPFKVYYKDLGFVSWVGLKGAVPIIFATYALVDDLPNADAIFHIVFFITLTSLLLQGTTLFKVASWLKLAIPEGKVKKTILEFESDSIKSVLDELEVKDNFRCINKSLIALNLPKTALIVMIERDGKHFTPNGNTKILAGDRLTVLADTRDNLDSTYMALRGDA